MSIELRNATVTYDKWGETVCPFRDLNVTIAEGEWLLLGGPNGSGKTTLLRCLAGMQPLKSGSATLWGEQPARLTVKRRAQMVYSITQNPLSGTASDLTVFENLYLAHGCPPKPRRELVRIYSESLEPFGVYPKLDQRMTELSGGQRQLIALAMVALRPARLILLDEPLAALDPVRARLALDFLRSLWEQGRTLIQVAHDPELLLTEGTRTIILAGGKFVYDERDTKRDSVTMQETMNLQTSFP